MRLDLNDIWEKCIEKFMSEYTRNWDERFKEVFRLSIEMWPDWLEKNIEANTRVVLESLWYSEDDIVTVTRFVWVNVRLLLSSKYIFLTWKQV